MLINLPDVILVIGGYNEEGDANITEVVSTDPNINPVPECMKTLNKFPLSSYYIRFATKFGE